MQLITERSLDFYLASVIFSYRIQKLIHSLSTTKFFLHFYLQPFYWWGENKKSPQSQAKLLSSKYNRCGSYNIYKFTKTKPLSPIALMWKEQVSEQMHFNCIDIKTKNKAQTTALRSTLQCWGSWHSVMASYWILIYCSHADIQTNALC